MVLRRPEGSTTTTPAPVTTTTPPIKLPDPPPPIVPEKPMLGAPTGTIGGPLKIAFGRGGPWSVVNAYDKDFLAAGKKHNVPPQMLKAMMVIESGGQSIPNQGGSGAWGPMQFKRNIWQPRVDVFGYNLDTGTGQVFGAAALLGGDIAGVRGDTPEERFLSAYYPTAGLDVPGEDGHTPRQYLADMHELMRQIDEAAGGTVLRGDVLDLLYGGNPYIISAEYGQRVTWQCPTGVNPGQPGNCYEYFEAYGLDDLHHWAYDTSARVGDGAPLYAPFDGMVVCAGTGVGRGAWDTGCIAFGHLNNYGGKPSGQGAGRLELLHEDGDRSLILGHALSSRVAPGNLVKQGDLVGQQGGMNGSHVHVEGRYAQGTKIGDPRKLFGGGAMPITYANPVPVPQTEAFEKWWTVTALHDGVPVYQRADSGSPLAFRPLNGGEEVEVVYFTISHEDGSMYAITRNSRRVPVSGLDLSSIKEFSNAQ